jgi:hypothetical protein
MDTLGQLRSNVDMMQSINIYSLTDLRRRRSYASLVRQCPLREAGLNLSPGSIPGHMLTISLQAPWHMLIIHGKQS